MEKIITLDGSVTLHSSLFGEAMHSKSGAKEEALLKFVEPCEIKSLARIGKIKILDVCFGLGYNSAMAIDIAWQENPKCVVEILGLENNEEILQTIIDLPDSFRCYPLIKEMIHSDYMLANNKLSIQVLLGDARKTIKKINDSFDVCFFDPFSPKKCPELWTYEMFQAIFNLLKVGGRITTYSCARVVRDNMKAADFVVFDGPKIWRRGPSTLGIKKL